MTDTGYELLAQILITVAVVWLVFRMFPPVRREKKMKTFLVYNLRFGLLLLGGIRATSREEVAEKYDLPLCDEDTLHRKGSPDVFLLEELRELPAEFFTDSQDLALPPTEGERPELTPLSENGPDPGLLTDKMEPVECADPPEPPPDDESLEP